MTVWQAHWGVQSHPQREWDCQDDGELHCGTEGGHRSDGERTQHSAEENRTNEKKGKLYEIPLKS